MVAILENPVYGGYDVIGSDGRVKAHVVCEDKAEELAFDLDLNEDDEEVCDG